MRIARAVRMLLVAFVTVAAVALLVPAVASGYAPGVTYAWVQPGAATTGVSRVWAQPPAWIPTAAVPATSAAALMNPAYHWVQPPAEIPAG